MKTPRDILRELFGNGYRRNPDGLLFQDPICINQALTALDALVPEKETYCRFDGGNYEHMHGRNEVIDEMHKIYKEKK